MSTFASLLKEQFDKGPDRVCMTMQFAGKPDLPITYRDLINGAAGYAKTFAENGVKPGDTVTLILQHGTDMLFSHFGAILHGAIPSFMPFLTEKLLPDRYREALATLIGVTHPSALVTYPEFEPEVRSAMERGKGTVKALIITDKVHKPYEPEDITSFGGFSRNPEDIAILQHSSGTTGLQKGVALSHRAVLNQIIGYSKAMNLTEKDIIVSWLPMYHDMGLIACWLMPILWGNHVVLMSPFDWMRAPYRLLQAISKYKGTLSFMPNFAFNFCAQKIRDRDLEGVDLSSLRAITNAGEIIRWESHQAFYERFKKYGFRYDAFASLYGMAENVYCLVQGGIYEPVPYEDIDRDSLQIDKIAHPAIPGKPSVRMMGCGKVMDNCEYKIFDAHGKALPDRHVGEVVVKSNCMLTEYYHRPDLTKEAFLGEWYLSGDYGYSVDGQLYITGRKKDLIIVGGKNIYPQDLEHLSYEVPGVHPGRSSAFGIYNEETGTEDVILACEVDTEDPEEQQKIAEQVRDVVTRGSAISLRYVYIVRFPWLAKSSSGKTARQANRERFLKEAQEKGLKY